ncbi:MAG: O-antigen ligase family protein [Fimbriimonadaceae bacterium]|nr:O-antigen ligase family protein [Chitinophagales bacterium]
MYLLLISGNRSSWLSLILALMIFVLKLKIIRTDFKILILIIPVLIIIWIAAIPESSLNMRLNDTEKQMEQGEARFDVAETATGYFNESKWKWFTGAGMFNYAEVIPGNQLSDYHNSYFEILFGGGVILFILFLNFMLFRPLYFYTLYYSKYFISIPPFIVIPYFEANITGGQFLFYPWFIFLLLYNIKPVSKQEEITLKERFYGKRMQERKHVYS